MATLSDRQPAARAVNEAASKLRQVLPRSELAQSFMDDALLLLRRAYRTSLRGPQESLPFSTPPAFAQLYRDSPQESLGLASRLVVFIGGHLEALGRVGDGKFVVEAYEKSLVNLLVSIKEHLYNCDAAGKDQGKVGTICFDSLARIFGTSNSARVQSKIIDVFDVASAKHAKNKRLLISQPSLPEQLGQIVARARDHNLTERAIDLLFRLTSELTVAVKKELSTPRSAGLAKEELIAWKKRTFPGKGAHNLKVLGKFEQLKMQDYDVEGMLKLLSEGDISCFQSVKTSAVVVNERQKVKPDGQEVYFNQTSFTATIVDELEKMDEDAVELTLEATYGIIDKVMIAASENLHAQVTLVLSRAPSFNRTLPSPSKSGAKPSIAFIINIDAIAHLCETLTARAIACELRPSAPQHPTPAPNCAQGWKGDHVLSTSPPVLPSTSAEVLKMFRVGDPVKSSKGTVAVEHAAKAAQKFSKSSTARPAGAGDVFGGSLLERQVSIFAPGPPTPPLVDDFAPENDESGFHLGGMSYGGILCPNSSDSSRSTSAEDPIRVASKALAAAVTSSNARRQQHQKRRIEPTPHVLPSTFVAVRASQNRSKGILKTQQVPFSSGIARNRSPHSSFKKIKSKKQNKKLKLQSSLQRANLEPDRTLTTANLIPVDENLTRVLYELSDVVAQKVTQGNFQVQSHRYNLQFWAQRQIQNIESDNFEQNEAVLQRMGTTMGESNVLLGGLLECIKTSHGRLLEIAEHTSALFDAEMRNI